MPDKIVPARDAAALVHSGDTVTTSGFVGAGVPEALLKALPLSPDEIRWAKGYLTRYHKGQAAVGETPENEFVWVESSSKGRSRKGKSRGKRHR